MLPITDGTVRTRLRNDVRIKDDRLRAVLDGTSFLLFDGAMGTMLQQRGLDAGELPELLCITNPDEITAIHRAYVEAGSLVATTNTFGANELKLGNRAAVEDVFAHAVSCARASGAAYVAADIGPTGALLEPLGTLSFDRAYDLFAREVKAADAAGADLFIIETMTDLLEMKAAVLAAKENSDLPIFATMTFGEDGRTFLGTSPAVAVAALDALGVNALGVNCSLGPDALAPLVTEMLSVATCPVIVQANAGLPSIVDGRTVYSIDPQSYAQSIARIVDAGASIIGGCCGTDPTYIRLLADVLEKRETPAPRSIEQAPRLTSAQNLVELHGRDIAVIGERINPTGKKKLKQALRDKDYDYVINMALDQAEAGSDLLDVNAGLPEIDEGATLIELVKQIQSVCGLPLQIDSSDPAAVEGAVRHYAGKALINSVNGKADNLAAVLPIAAHYGCAVVGLTLDEGGIPSTAEKRFAIAERIVNEANRYGIPREDVYIDCLTMAASTNQSEVIEILRTLRMVKEHLGVRTVLGVSNISFGLPAREVVNSAFLAAAFAAGLDMPILNPMNERFAETVAAWKLLCGQDEGATAFVENFSSYKPMTKRIEETRAEAARTAAAQASAQAAADVAAAATNAAALIAQGIPVGGAPKSAPSAVSSSLGAAAARAFAPSAASAQATAPAAAAGAVFPVTNASTRNGADGVTESAGDASGANVGGSAVDGSASDTPASGTLDAASAELRELVVSGRKGAAGEATKRVIAAHDPLYAINECLIPALDIVGDRFEAGTFFLPQLMASAEAAKAGFDVVKSQLASEGTTESDKGPVALATVKGDIHDIGKNIVKMLLENYGFKVYDLGRDVDPSVVLDCVRDHDVKLVGLSALMTTTVHNMKETIDLIHKEFPDTKVFVGGAVLNEEYAKMVGADYYTKDAAASARVATELFGA